MQYVRKQAKGFGRMAQIEGELHEGARALLVEDLATDGGSKLRFIEALRNAGAIVTDAFVIFHYGIFPQSVAGLAALGVRLHALATWWDVLSVARADGYFDAETLDEVERFLNDPDGWSASRAAKA
jgi:orotate phosphoribosyltransferase